MLSSANLQADSFLSIGHISGLRTLCVFLFHPAQVPEQQLMEEVARSSSVLLFCDSILRIRDYVTQVDAIWIWSNSSGVGQNHT